MAHKIIGIDLGSYSVKVVVASAGFRSITVADVIEEPVPPGEGTTEERGWQVVGRILRSRGLENEIPHVAFPGEAVSIRVLEFGFSGLKRADLDKAVGSELEGQLPHDLDELVYDFEPIPLAAEVQTPVAALADDAPTQVKSPPKPAAVAGTRILAAATTQERIGQFLKLAGQQAIEPRSVLAAPTVYARITDKVAALGLAEAKHEPVLVIDHGHQRTNVCVVKHGRTLFARTLSRGGRQITAAIARTWNLTFEDAERAKHVDGFITGQIENVGNERHPGLTALADVIRQELAPLVRDLRQTISACRAQTGAMPVRALLCGGGGRLRGLAPYLGEELGLPVGMLAEEDVPRLLGAGAHGVTGALDVALLAHGVAMEGTSGRPLFDLRKGQLAYRADLSFLRAKAAYLAACVLVLIAFAAANAYAALHKLRKEETLLDARLERETTEVFGEPVTATDVQERIAPKKDESPLPKQTAFDQLVEISKRLPARDKLKLDVLELDVKALRITLRAKTDTLKSLDDIEKELKAIDCFTDVQRGKVQGPEGEKEFTLTITTKCM